MNAQLLDLFRAASVSYRAMYMLATVVSSHAKSSTRITSGNARRETNKRAAIEVSGHLKYHPRRHRRDHRSYATHDDANYYS